MIFCYFSLLLIFNNFFWFNSYRIFYMSLFCFKSSGILLYMPLSFFFDHFFGWGFDFRRGKYFYHLNEEGKKENMVLGWRNYMIYNLKDIWVYIYFWLSSFFNHFSRWGFSLRRENYFYYLNKEGKRGFRVTVVYDFTL